MIPMKKFNPYWLFFKVLVAAMVIGVGYAAYHENHVRIVLLGLLAYGILFGIMVGLIRLVIAGINWDRNNQ